VKQNMAFKRRLSRAFQELEDAGIARSSYLPVIYGLILRFGFERPPPHYCPMLQNVLISGTWFAPVWGVLMWLLVWSGEGVPGVRAVATGLAGGLVFGLIMGSYYRRGARTHGLTPWDELSG
tara:strand:- start:586 stop:951 length:366 start_codon:yes stop_codon:yes gene_type:complete